MNLPTYTTKKKTACKPRTASAYGRAVKKLDNFSERKKDIGERVHETVACVEFDHLMSKAKLPNLTGVFNIAKHRDTEILLWLL